MFIIGAAITSPGLLRVPFEKPFILVIACLVLALAVTFGLIVGAIGALLGRRSSRPRPGGSAHGVGPDPITRQNPGAERGRSRMSDISGSTWSEIRFAARACRLSPAFSAAVIGTFALMLSAVGLTWGAFDAIVLGAVPGRHPGRVATVSYTSPLSPRFAHGCRCRIWPR